MAGQGIPGFDFSTHSNVGVGEDNSHVRLHPTGELVEGEATNTEGPRASIICIPKMGTPASNITGMSNSAPNPYISALLGLPEGETLASWYAKQIATINVAYQSLSAQQAILQV
ncbi:hypothetical protein Hanom_Chr14g01294831 [Helianthus anomalus]